MVLVQLVLLGLQIDGMHGFQVFDVTSELPDVSLMLLQDFILVGYLLFKIFKLSGQVLGMGLQFLY